LRDFLNALVPIKAIWVELFRMLNYRNIIAGILIYQDIANKLHTMVRDKAGYKGTKFEASFYSVVVD
jgi:hypothetical protein